MTDEKQEEKRLWVTEEYAEVVTKDGEQRSVLMGYSDPYESYFTSPSQAYKESVRLFGRCISKIYIYDKDHPNKPIHIGWVFRNRVPYEDVKTETYLREVWVTLHDGPPVKTIKYFHHKI